MNKLWWMRGPLRDPEDENQGGGAGPNSAVQDPSSTNAGEFSDSKKLLDEMRALRESMSRPAPAPAPAPPPPMNAPITREQMEERFWKDPLSSSAAIAQHATNQALNAFQQGLGPSMAALEEIAKNEARKAAPAIFDKYSAAIEAKMSLVPPQFRSNPNTWRNAFNAVRGEHFDDIVKETQAAPPGSTDGPGVAAPRRSNPTKPGANLSEDEARIASKLKLTPEEYAHGKQLVNNQAQSWNTVFTFETGQSGVREQSGR